MRDYRAPRTQRIISAIRFYMPELATGLMFIAFLLFLPIIGAIF